MAECLQISEAGGQRHFDEAAFVRRQHLLTLPDTSHGCACGTGIGQVDGWSYNGPCNHHVRESARRLMEMSVLRQTLLCATDPRLLCADPSWVPHLARLLRKVGRPSRRLSNWPRVAGRKSLPKLSIPLVLRPWSKGSERASFSLSRGFARRLAEWRDSGVIPTTQTSMGPTNKPRTQILSCRAAIGWGREPVGAAAGFVCASAGSQGPSGKRRRDNAEVLQATRRMEFSMGTMPPVGEAVFKRAQVYCDS